MKERHGGDDRARRGVSRRGFLTSVGAGAVGAAVASAEPAAAEARATAAGEPVTLALAVNGRQHRLRRDDPHCQRREAQRQRRTLLPRLAPDAPDA